MTVATTPLFVVLQLWQDYQLKWEPADFGSITTIRILPHKVWKPDIVLFNKYVYHQNNYMLSECIPSEWISSEWISSELISPGLISSELISPECLHVASKCISSE